MNLERIEAAYDQGREAVVALFAEMYADFEARLAEQDRIIAELRARLDRDSHNSSQPPSQDVPWKKPQPKSLRQRGQRRPGGQPGHEGHTLDMTDTPDQTKLYRPTRCDGCGCDLTGVAGTCTERRQVFDLPPQRLQVTEHQVEEVVCPHCHYISVGAFPVEVSQPVQYGPSILALGLALLQFQHLPYERASQLLRDIFGQGPSPGTLAETVRRCSDGLDETLLRITDALRASPLLHVDETGTRLAGILVWVHVMSTSFLTSYHADFRRGRQAIEHAAVLPGFGGTLVRDGAEFYWAYGKRHALCNAHHLRELTAFEEQGCVWATGLKVVLLVMKELADAAREDGLLEVDPVLRATLRAVYREFLRAGFEAHPKAAPSGNTRGRTKQSPAYNLLQRLNKYEDAVLLFFEDLSIPFDNNQAERDLRPIKLHQKVSGTYRADWALVASCRIRSYISTARKQGQQVLDVLERALRGHPFQPELQPSG